MITWFEQIIGFLTLIALGLSVILSRFVTASTSYYLEVNFGINQYALGLLCILCSIPLATGLRRRSTYFVCLFPYNLYLIGNIRYVYVAHLASVVPALLSVLWLALMYGMLLDFVRSLLARRGKHGTERATAYPG